MDNFKIDARQIKAAMFMQAKSDVRYYLNGLLIGDGKIVATDGHRMIIVDSDKATFEPTIFAIKGQLVKSATECEFIFMGDDHGIVISKNARGVKLDQVIKFSIVDSKYPDWNRVIPSGEPKETSEVAFNVNHIADISKAAAALGNSFGCGKFTFYGDEETTAAVIDISALENKAKCVIVAMRI